MQSKPKYKVCKRLGSGVYEKCQSPRYMLSEQRTQKNNNNKRPQTLSDFGKQLIEKQRVRLLYGLGEKQFRNYVHTVVAHSHGDAREELLKKLETRLDNVIFRLGIASTRRAARQMVSHGHILVNNKRTTSPSYTVTSGDTISIREGSKSRILFSALKEKEIPQQSVPSWLSFDIKKLEAKILHAPKIDDIEMPIDIRLVLEFYSR